MATEKDGCFRALSTFYILEALFCCIERNVAVKSCGGKHLSVLSGLY